MHIIAFILTLSSTLGVACAEHASEGSSHAVSDSAAARSAISGTTDHPQRTSALTPPNLESREAAGPSEQHTEADGQHTDGPAIPNAQSPHVSRVQHDDEAPQSSIHSLASQLQAFGERAWNTPIVVQIRNAPPVVKITALSVAAAGGIWGMWQRWGRRSETVAPSMTTIPPAQHDPSYLDPRYEAQLNARGWSWPWTRSTQKPATVPPLRDPVAPCTDPFYSELKPALEKSGLSEEFCAAAINIWNSRRHHDTTVPGQPSDLINHIEWGDAAFILQAMRAVSKSSVRIHPGSIEQVMRNKFSEYTTQQPWRRKLNQTQGQLAEQCKQAFRHQCALFDLDRAIRDTTEMMAIMQRQPKDDSGGNRALLATTHRLQALKGLLNSTEQGKLNTADSIRVRDAIQDLAVNFQIKQPKDVIKTNMATLLTPDSGLDAVSRFVLYDESMQPLLELHPELNQLAQQLRDHYDNDPDNFLLDDGESKSSEAMARLNDLQGQSGLDGAPAGTRLDITPRSIPGSKMYTPTDTRGSVAVHAPFGIATAVARTIADGARALLGFGQKPTGTAATPQRLQHNLAIPLRLEAPAAPTPACTLAASEEGDEKRLDSRLKRVLERFAGLSGRLPKDLTQASAARAQEAFEACKAMTAKAEGFSKQDFVLAGEFLDEIIGYRASVPDKEHAAFNEHELNAWNQLPLHVQSYFEKNYYLRHYTPERIQTAIQTISHQEQLERDMKNSALSVIQAGAKRLLAPPSLAPSERPSPPMERIRSEQQTILRVLEEYFAGVGSWHTKEAAESTCNFLIGKITFGPERDSFCYATWDNLLPDIQAFIRTHPNLKRFAPSASLPSRHDKT